MQVKPSASDQLKVELKVEAYINGEEIYVGHNTINNFEYFASRCFNSATAFRIPIYIRYILTPGDQDIAATYGEVSNTQHDFAASWQAADAGGTWTGCEIYSNDATNTKIASCRIPRSIIPQTDPITYDQVYVSQDTLNVHFHFTLSGTGFTNDGFKRFGHLCLDPANSYTTFDDVALLYYGVERNRPAATYAKVSDTVHNLIFKPPIDDMITAFRIYDATSGGNYCYEKIFTQPRIYLPTYQEILKITLSQS